MVSFHHQLSCLKPLFDLEMSTDFDTCLEDFKQSSLVELTLVLVEKLKDKLLEAVKHLDSEFQKLITSCVESVSMVAMDTEGDIAKLGEAWVHLGYLQMTLLAPKGPVDPVERQATKLKILKQEVRM